MDVRASDAERDAAIERLRDAAAEGRLTFEELADRIEAAASAVMRSDLEPLTADLPAGGAAAPGGADGGPRAQRRQALRRVGRARPTAASAPGSGHIQLDLRQATDQRAARSAIHACTLFGKIDVLVPEGVEVDVRARSKLGQLKLQDRAARRAGAPRVVLTGGTVFGVDQVRHKRLWEKVLGRVL